MRKLLTGIYIESGYDGVSVGVIELEKGMLLIDAPLKAEDGRAWLEDIAEINSDKKRLLVNLDSNPDRTLGVKSIECPVIAHSETVQTFSQRPAIFKAQSVEGGFEWEMVGGLSGTRWKHPDQFVSKSIEIHWGGKELFLVHQPGPESGALWVVVPQQKVVFVGDAVVTKQPPFLDKANIPEWLDTLDVLMDDYKGYKVISSRGGVVDEKDLKFMKKFLLIVQRQMEKLGKKKAAPTVTQKYVDKYLGQWDVPTKYKEFYTDRLRHGLSAYYARNIYSQKIEGEE